MDINLSGYKSNVIVKPEMSRSIERLNVSSRERQKIHRSEETKSQEEKAACYRTFAE